MSINNARTLLDLSLLMRVLRLAVPYQKGIFIAIVVSLVLALLAPVRPYFIQLSFDEIIPAQRYDSLLHITLLFVITLMAETLLRYYFSYLTAWLGARIIFDVRNRVYGHVLFSKLSYFDTTPIGTATTRTITDVEAINDTFSEGLITILSDVLTIVLVACYMFYTNWRLAVMSLFCLPLLLLVTRWFQRGVKASFQEERTQIGRLNAFLQEHITGMRIIQMFNVEAQEKKKFEAINDALTKANVKGIWYYSLYFPAVEILLAASVGAMVWYATGQILHGAASVGVISSFILLINMLFRPLRFIADKVNTIQRGVVAAERVFKLLDNEQHITDHGHYSVARARGDICFDRVWFAYNDDHYVLRDVSFKIPAGETLAIVGATGSGKTSTIALLARFYDIQRGDITIDQVSLRDWQLDNLRAQMGVVLQDVFLFAGTVYDNITLRNTKIPHTQVVAAARAIGAHDFIMQLPGGYQYEVMERGATLSLGQRQLISFVRALVYNPAILILDEATSSIDVETERVVQNAIEKLVKGRTSIVIAHRLSTIRHAHKIAVFDQGTLREFGTHETLLTQNGIYTTLYKMQFEKTAKTNVY